MAAPSPTVQGGVSTVQTSLLIRVYLMFVQDISAQSDCATHKMSETCLSLLKLYHRVSYFQCCSVRPFV